VNPVEEYRRQLAEALKPVTGLDVTPHPPTTPRGSTGFLRPSQTTSWFDMRAVGASWCAPMVALDLWLVAPPLPALAESLGWFEERVLAIAEAVKTATLANGRKLPGVQSVTDPRLLDAGSGLLAVIVQLAPTSIERT